MTDIDEKKNKQLKEYYSVAYSYVKLGLSFATQIFGIALKNSFKLFVTFSILYVATLGLLGPERGDMVFNRLLWPVEKAINGYNRTGPELNAALEKVALQEAKIAELGAKIEV